MDEILYNRIANSTAHRASRDGNADFVLKNPEILSDLMIIDFDTNDKNHHRACWVLELVYEANLELLMPFLDDFCGNISKLDDDSAIRPIAKVCLFLSKSKSISLNQKQETQLVETCFDWLIQEEKVAAKVYAMRTLSYFGKKYDWIYPELKTIITQDFPNHSAAYKAGAKDVLKRLK